MRHRTKLAISREESRMKYLLRILVSAAALVFGPAVHADDYPSKPITFVAVFGPGSASDTLCRIIGQRLSMALKETVIVDNRPGANGALAATYVARSAPDGYTLLMATNSPLSAAPFINKSVPYDPVKDFTPVTRVGSFTLCWWSTPASRRRTSRS
jgi:tripartite-type tricarboxylate transporter receptor subunit TctC